MGLLREGDTPLWATVGNYGREKGGMAHDLKAPDAIVASKLSGMGLNPWQAHGSSFELSKENQDTGIINKSKE